MRPRHVPVAAVVALAALCAGPAPCRAATALVDVAGDVAQCENLAGASATARLVPADAAVVMLGDAAYPFGNRQGLDHCYGPTWGAFLARTYPVPGNHDYVHGSPNDYLAYFGGRGFDPRRYRVALGDWWLFGLDSNLAGAELDAQLAWLRSELDAIRGDGRCILAAWHHPLYSTGLHRGDGERMRPAWRALAEAGADIVLNGHEHFYEAYAPRDAAGASATAGIREFIVGTGGARLADLSLSPWEHRAYARRRGVLELDLQPREYRWRFIATDGTVLDQGAAACGAALSSP